MYFKSNQMKEDIFEQYVDKVIQLYSISREELFARSKKRYIVDARNLLCYLCFNRKIKLITIQEFMGKNNYKTSHSPIIYSINTVVKKAEEDKDYRLIIKNIDNSVFI